MDLTELNRNIKNLPNEESILNIIQQRIDNEMNTFSKEISSNTHKLIVELKSLENKVDSSQKLIMWMTGTLAILIVAVVVAQFFK